jgi:hypothetical protein
MGQTSEDLAPTVSGGVLTFEGDMEPAVENDRDSGSYYSQESGEGEYVKDPMNDRVMEEVKEMIRQFVQMERRDFPSVEDERRKQLYSGVLHASSYRLPRCTRNICTELERRKILRRCRRDWTANECMWKEEVREQQSFTKCNVHRTRKGFEYKDTHTGFIVAAEEYEQRIIEFNERNKGANRLKRTLSAASNSSRSMGSQDGFDEDQEVNEKATRPLMTIFDAGNGRVRTGSGLFPQPAKVSKLEGNVQSEPHGSATAAVFGITVPLQEAKSVGSSAVAINTDVRTGSGLVDTL